MNNFLSTALTLFLVIDALGSIPSYLSVINQLKERDRKKVALRELLFSLLIFFIFFFLGHLIVLLLNVDPTIVAISGGVILFIVALRLIFGSKELTPTQWHPGSHMIVPIATPLIASPSFFAVLMIFTEGPIPNVIVIEAMLVAWFASVLIYLSAAPIYRFMKDQGLLAIKRFTGLLVALIAVQKILQAIIEILGK